MSATSAAASVPPTPSLRRRRLPYKRPLRVYMLVVIAFMLLNYLVWSTETDETGKYRILPDYVHEAAETRDNHLRDHEEPPLHYMLLFEEKVMGSIFKLGLTLFGSFRIVQLVLALTWIIHMFELGVCVRTCVQCNASVLVMLRYCFCTAAAGFAQLGPLAEAKEAYLEQETGEEEGKRQD